MKIIDIDLKENGKKYFCKQANEVFKVEEGNLIPVTRSFSMADLLKFDFEEIKETKNPYTRVDYKDWYYAIERAGSVTSLADNSDYDDRMFNIANYFNNKNYAEYVDFKENLMRKLDKFAWEHNAKVINWDRDVEKYYIVFSNQHSELIIDWDFVLQSNNIYFTSRKIAEQALEKFKDDLMKLYTWEFDF